MGVKDNEKIKKNIINTTSYILSKCFWFLLILRKFLKKKRNVSAQDRTGDLLRSMGLLLGRRDNRYTTETMGRKKHLNIDTIYIIYYYIPIII